MSFKFTKSNLNFDVYTVASKPTAPGANNDIAIITSVPMPNWIMSPDKPSGRPRSDGDVWIQYSVSGNTFNALKNNSMMIATISAWQYVDGVWAEVEAVSCQNGEWVEWVTYLYNLGDKCTDITGGWQFVSTRGGCTVGSYTDNGESITLNGSSSAMQSTSYCTKIAVDLTDVNKLWINVIKASGSYLRFKVGTTVSMDNGAVRSDNCPVGSSYIDVSNRSGMYYVAVEVYSDKAKNGSVTFDKIWME